jgi:hypothetical protein
MQSFATKLRGLFEGVGHNELVMERLEERIVLDGAVDFSKDWLEDGYDGGDGEVFAVSKAIDPSAWIAVEDGWYYQYDGTYHYYRFDADDNRLFRYDGDWEWYDTIMDHSWETAFAWFTDPATGVQAYNSVDGTYYDTIGPTWFDSSGTPHTSGSSSGMAYNDHTTGVWLWYDDATASWQYYDGINLHSWSPAFGTYYDATIDADVTHEIENSTYVFDADHTYRQDHATEAWEWWDPSAGAWIAYAGNPLTDPPTIVVADLPDVDEDNGGTGFVDLSAAFSVDDPRGRDLQVTLTASQGFDFIDVGSGGGSALLTQVSPTEWVVSGPIAEVNAALGTLNGLLTPNFNGTAMINIEAVQGSQSATDLLNLTVLAVNDPPVITTVGQSDVLEDSGQLDWSDAFRVEDIDGDTLTVDIQGSGPLQDLNLSGAGVIKHGPLHYEIVGTESLVNTVLASLMPTLLANGNGAAGVSVSVFDGTVNVTDSITIMVVGVNDPPVTTSWVTNQGAVPIQLNSWTFSDPLDNPPNNWLSLTIESFPTDDCTMWYQAGGTNVQVLPGDTISAADAANLWVFVNPAEPYAIINFHVVDDGGTFNGGDNTSDSAQVTVFTP